MRWHKSKYQEKNRPTTYVRVKKPKHQLLKARMNSKFPICKVAKRNRSVSHFSQYKSIQACA
uniref:Uncharacterized protein n=1 Tax=Rhizophora mucronata TaxID=61149 RepID=A0A2P2QYA2_RHIMU